MEGQVASQGGKEARLEKPGFKKTQPLGVSGLLGIIGFLGFYCFSTFYLPLNKQLTLGRHKSVIPVVTLLTQ